MTLDEASLRLEQRMLEPMRTPRHVRKELEAQLAQASDPLLERLHGLVASCDMRTTPYYVRMIQACVALAPTLEPELGHQLVDHVAGLTKRFHLAR
mgnify:CR=1 FL=1